VLLPAGDANRPITLNFTRGIKLEIDRSRTCDFLAGSCSTELVISPGARKIGLGLSGGFYHALHCTSIINKP